MLIYVNRNVILCLPKPSMLIHGHNCPCPPVLSPHFLQVASEDLSAYKLYELGASWRQSDSRNGDEVQMGETEHIWIIIMDTI